MTALLEVRDLRTSFKLEGGGEFAAVEGSVFRSMQDARSGSWASRAAEKA